MSGQIEPWPFEPTRAQGDTLKFLQLPDGGWTVGRLLDVLAVGEIRADGSVRQMLIYNNDDENRVFNRRIELGQIEEPEIADEYL